MEIKYLEWNVNARGGKDYKIPDFICNHLNKVDVFVLVEFRMDNGWDTFLNNLTEFDVYCSPYIPKGYNQVCVGIRKTMNYKLLSVVSNDVCDVNVPEFLQVDIEIADKQLSIIGTRIKTQGRTKEQQFVFLKSYLAKIDTFFCLGDFNALYRPLRDRLKSYSDTEVYGPRIKNGYHSFVCKNGDKRGLDWIFSRGITVYNGYPDAKSTPYATYDWSFLTPENGYGTATKDNFLNIRSLPDHAILKGMIKI